MKKNNLLLIVATCSISLLSCTSMAKHYPIKDYIIDYKYSDTIPFDFDGDFNILQLSDIHLGYLDNVDLQFKFISKTINRTKKILENEGRKLHMIAITGDLFTFADKNSVYDFTNFFESFKTPWTVTFGNHDEQGFFSVDWMTNYFTSVSNRSDTYLHFKDLINDDVFGSANFVIDLGDYDGQSRQIIMLDSNRYNYCEEYFGYDYIHYDQVNWYKNLSEYFKNKNHNANSLAFFHIPLMEYREALNTAKAGKHNAEFLSGGLYKDGIERTYIEKRDCDKDKSDGSPKINTGFFDAALNTNYLKATFVGHSHTNTYCVDYQPENYNGTNTISLCYGVKSTDRVYYDENMIGGQIIRYHSSPNIEDSDKGKDWIDLDLVFHKYTDLDKEDK